MALVCVNDYNFGSDTKILFNTDHVSEITQYKGYYLVRLTASTVIKINKDDLKKTFKAMGYDDDQADLYIALLN